MGSLLSAASLLGGVVALLPGCSSPDSAPGACRTFLNCKDEAAPVCDAAALVCRTCQMGVDDVACKNRSAATPRCGATGRCVGCLTSADCTGGKPICGANNTCTGCSSASDCDSKVCNPDHSCAPASDVLFVDNKGGACSGTTHSGTLDDPYCSIQDAVNAAVSVNKSLISVAPSAKPYDSVSITTVGSAGLRISSSSGAAGSVNIVASSGAAFSVTAPSPAKVVLSGFDLMAATGTGVDCSNGADLTVTLSRVHHSNNGVVARGCNVTLDSLRVYRNSYNGINLNSSTTYALSNLMVWSNAQSGITLSSSTGTLRFATVYGNGAIGLSQPPGINCGASGNVVESSIVYSNISTNTGALTDNQIVGCTIGATVVTNDSKAAGASIKQTVEFMNATGSDFSAFDLRLKPDSSANADCCIDKVPQMSGLPDHDIDNNRRPQGLGWDIGASEAR